MDDKDTARLLALLRVVLGAGLFVMPKFSAKTWTGSRDVDFPTDIAVRGMGVRDVALGLGALMALESGRGARGWFEAGAIVDASDAVGTLVAWRDLPGFRRLALLAAEVGAAYLGLQIASALDE